MNCPNCQSDVKPGEKFCLACCTELPNADPNAVTAASTPATDNTAPASSTPPPGGNLLLALNFDNQEFPVYDNGSVIIARSDTDKCQPNIAIASDRVSSAPVEVK